MAVPIYDNHVHLNPEGRNVEALRVFEAAGGTGLTLVTLPYREVPISSGEDFLRSFRITLSLAERGRDATGLRINVAVGPYPVLIIPLAENYGLERAERIMAEGMEAAARLVSEGKADAIGEVGRPHFPVAREISEASDRVLMRGMELARDIGCPVIIHSESEPSTYGDLRRMADAVSLDPGRVVKHSSGPLVTESETLGIVPSIPASRSTTREALAKGNRFMLETDYIDDPGNASAVMSINTVPKRIKAMRASGEMSDEDAHRICGEIPQRLYDFR
ncbi:MAG: TatD family hydrolase [Candidatus Methanomethylophilaceae archaeon]